MIQSTQNALNAAATLSEALADANQDARSVIGKLEAIVTWAEGATLKANTEHKAMMQHVNDTFTAAMEEVDVRHVAIMADIDRGRELALTLIEFVQKGAKREDAPPEKQS